MIEDAENGWGWDGVVCVQIGIIRYSKRTWNHENCKPSPDVAHALFPFKIWEGNTSTPESP